MPIYEYHCQPCDHTFEALLRNAAETPHCPRCGTDQELNKQFSVPAASHSATASRANLPSLPVGGCGAPACCGGSCSID